MKRMKILGNIFVGAMKKIKEKVIEKKEKIITWAKRFTGEMMRFLLNDQVYIGIILLIV